MTKPVDRLEVNSFLQNKPISIGKWSLKVLDHHNLLEYGLLDALLIAQDLFRRVLVWKGVAGFKDVKKLSGVMNAFRKFLQKNK